MSYSYTSFGSLLSSTGMQSLQNYQNNKTYMNGLKSISTPNSYLNKECGFDTKSIFNCGSNDGSSSYTGTSSEYMVTPYSGWTLGSDGFNRRGPVNKQITTRSAIPQTDNPYSGGVHGASIVGNYYTAIQSEALGQYAPTSVFEQRLNYHLTYAQQLQRAGVSSDNVSQAASSKSVSDLMSKLPSTKTSNTNSTLNASGASSVSEMMSFFKYC